MLWVFEAGSASYVLSPLFVYKRSIRMSMPLLAVWSMSRPIENEKKSVLASNVTCYKSSTASSSQPSLFCAISGLVCVNKLGVYDATY